MKEIYFYIIIILYFATGCSKTSKETNQDNLIEIPKTVEVDSSLGWKKICDLDENLEVLGNINSFDFLDSDHFVVSVSEGAQVILYNTRGEQLGILGKKGKGPFEYVSPSIVRVKNQNIYVWCSKLLKLIKFDSSGKPVEEYTKFERAIKDFVIYNNYAGFYSAGGYDESVLKIYDLNAQKFLKGYGYKTNEHKILNAFKSTDGLTKGKNNIYFTPLNTLNINKINLNNTSITSYTIDDPDFEMEKVNINASKFLMNFKKCMQFFFKTDFIQGLYYTDKGLIVNAQLGNIGMRSFRRPQKKKIDIKLKNPSGKTQNYYVFDRKMNLKYKVQTFIENIRKHNDLLYASHGKYLYILYLKENSTYEIKKINLHEF